jgi:hypothetical protein
MAIYNTYSNEQIDFLKINAPLMSRKELTERFNEKFQTSKSELAIKSYCNNRGFNSSSDGKFKDGNISWQTGLNKEEFKSHYTEESFNRLLTPMLNANKTLKIGDETIKHGIPHIVISVDYDIPFESRIIPKRRYVWIQAHGEIPETHCIIHLDGDDQNCDIDNLYCMPTRFKPLIAKNQWWTGNRELTLTAIKWCELFYAIRDVN